MVKTYSIRSSRREGQGQEGGFTLVELMIVMAIMLILTAMAVPKFTTYLKGAKEASLRENLHVLRGAIDAYTVDKQKAPQSLDDLVQAGYVKSIPVDPFTQRSDTWIAGQSDIMSSLDQTEGGINDVHSGAQMSAIDGTSYSSW